MAKHVRHVDGPFSYHNTPGELVVRVQPSPLLKDRYDVIYGGTGMFIGTKARAIAVAKDVAEAYGARVEIAK